MLGLHYLKRTWSILIVSVLFAAILNIGNFSPFKISIAKAEHIETAVQLPIAYKIANIVTDSDNLYIGGSVLNQSSTPHDDAFIRKYDLDFNEVWTTQFGSTQNDKLTGLAWHSSAVYVVGTKSGQQFLAKFDSTNGQLIWEVNVPPPTSGFIQLNEVAVDSSGVYIAGTVVGIYPNQDSPPAEMGVRNGFVRQYDFDGNEVWTKQFAARLCCESTEEGPILLDDPTNVEALGINLDSSGVYVIGGVGTDGVIDGAILLGDESRDFSNHSFLRKYGNDGTALWTNQFGSTSRGNTANDVIADSGLVYVTGGATFVGGYVETFDTDGDFQWRIEFGDMNLAVTADSSGIYFGGFQEDVLGETHRGLAAKVSNDGELLWFRSVAGVDSSSRVEVTDALVFLGSVYFVGNSDTHLFGQTENDGGFILKIGSDEPIKYRLQIVPDSFPPDYVPDIGGTGGSLGSVELDQEVRAVARTNDPEVTDITFRWLKPNGEVAHSFMAPVDDLGAARDSFAPGTGGTWTVEADFGNGTVVRETLTVSFLVIPESPLGTLVLIASSLAALAGFFYFKQYRNKLPR